MSGSLTAALRLTLKDEASSGVKALDEVFNRLNATLERLSTALAPLASLTDALTKTTEGASRLDAALEASSTATRRVTEATRGASVAVEMMGSAFGGASWQVTEFSASLGELAGAEEAVGSAGEAMGGEIVAGAERATVSVDALMARVRALHEVLDRTRGPALGGMGASFGGWAGDVHQAGRGFADSLQGSMHHGMNAAMATLAMLEPVHAAAEYDNDLTHIGIGLGLHGSANTEFMRQFGARMDALARETGQSSPALVEAAGFLGREGYTGDRLNAVLPTVARIATAYTSNPHDVAQSAFSIHEGLKISDGGLQRSLASMAMAGKVADMPMEELSSMFPQVVSQAAAFGVHGQKGLDNLLSALAIVRKNTGSLGTAVADLGQLLVVPQSTAGVKNFAKLGVDINKVKADTLKSGGDPLQVLLETIDRVTDHTQNSKAMQTLFHNVQDRAAAAAIIQHWKGDPSHGDFGYTDVQKRLQNTTPADVDEDFKTGLGSTKIRLQAFNESLGELNRRVGEGFVPTLNVMTSALNHVNKAFEWMDQSVPGSTSAIIGSIGAVLGLTAATAALGVVWGPLKAGFTLVTTALRGIALAEAGATAGLASFLGVSTAAASGIVAAFVGIGIAIADIALHWSRFSGSFRTLGHGLMEEARGLGNVLAGALHFDWQRILAGMGQGMRGIGTAWSGAWGIVKQLALDFTRWLDGWGAGIPLRILSALTAEWHVLTDGIAGQIGKMETAFDTSWLGRHMGMAAPVPAGAPAHVPTPAAANAAQQAAQFGVHVSADRGLSVRQVSGPQKGLTVAPQNTGRMVGRP